MGVSCQIHIERPPDGVYRPGSHVVGLVKYSVDKDTVFNSILVSLKGYGYSEWVNTEPRRTQHYRAIYEGNDTHVKNEVNLLTNHNGLVTTGEYNAPFHFILPHNIPSSFNYDSWSRKAEIAYYVRLKFIESGVFNKTKRFRSDIKVLSPLIPIQGPLVAVVQKNVKKIFGRENSAVNLKATINQSLVPSGGNVGISVQVENNSNVDVATVKIKLLRRLTLKSDCGRVYTSVKEVNECKIKTDAVPSDTSANIERSLKLPNDALTIQHSRVVLKDYSLKFILKMCGLHSDAGMELPIQVGETIMQNDVYPGTYRMPLCNDQPPSYWELMEEENVKGAIIT